MARLDEAGLDEAGLDAAVLDEAVLVARLRTAGCVFAEDEARLLRDTAGTPAELRRLVDSRVAGTPLEVVVGWAEFRGLRVAVEPGVFVPRRRTRFLVDLALAERPRPSVVVDLCCGSGAVAAALGHVLGSGRMRRPDIHAVDIDPVAVHCARRNLADVGQVWEGDLYGALPGRLRGRVDLLLANAPYVPTAEIAFLPPEARLYEPLVALDGGADGTGPGRRIAAGAADWLAPGGWVLIESSQAQAPALAVALATAGLDSRIETDPELQATVVTGRRAAARAVSG